MIGNYSRGPVVMQGFASASLKLFVIALFVLLLVSDLDGASVVDSPGEYALAHLNKGDGWLAKGDYDRAIADYNQAIHLDAMNSYAYYNRGGAWAEKGDYDRAIADYKKAMRTDPNDARPLTELARILATCPKDEYRDGKRALEFAIKA